MNHRKILYGFQYQTGELIIHPQEAVTVQRIFASYLTGLSYQKTADMLNGDHIPFSEETAHWDKHKIKRLLENPRYAGAGGYPQIVDSDTFQTVQAKIQEKHRNNVKAVPRPVLQFKPYLMCADCGTSLRMDSAESRSGNKVRLRCRKCGFQFDIPDEEFMEPIRSQITDRQVQPQEETYNPSEEVMRLTNAVNRALEHPDDPDHIVSLILRGVSARYDCCASPRRESANIWFDEEQLHQIISHITVSPERNITVHFQSP